MYNKYKIIDMFYNSIDMFYNSNKIISICLFL